MTNYEKIKAMGIEEMAEMLVNMFCEDHDIGDNTPIKKQYDSAKDRLVPRQELIADYFCDFCFICCI